MRKFIITNLLTIMALPLMACAGGGTFNYYLYMLYSNDEFSNRMQNICNDNWRVYLDMGKDDWFYFDADKIVKTAQSKNDPLMAMSIPCFRRRRRRSCNSVVCAARPARAGASGPRTRVPRWASSSPR